MFKFKKRHNIELISPIRNVPPPPPPNIEINHIAVVLDGIVQEILRGDNKMADLLTSQPTFILFSVDGHNNHSAPKIGWKYDGKNFIEPNKEKTTINDEKN